jgi:hypothetical protein
MKGDIMPGETGRMNWDRTMHTLCTGAAECCTGSWCSVTCYDTASRKTKKWNGRGVGKLAVHGDDMC